MKKIDLIILTAALAMFLFGCQNSSALSESQSDSVVQTEMETEAVEMEAETDITESEVSEVQTGVISEMEVFTNLEIEVSEGTIYIRSGESFSLTSQNGNSMDYEISGSTLYIQTGHKKEAVLVLPENVSYDTLKLTVKNGHAYMEDSVTFGSLILQVSQGEASLENISVLEESAIQVDEGSVSVHGNPGMTVTADCRQGNLNLAVPFEDADCNYEITLSGGNIQLGSRNYNGKSASHTIDNNGERTMELSCTHGNLSVEFDR